jgi:uncharacterized cupredoxin-like copper-binding protein
LTSRVLVLALSTGHKVGLAVVGAVFIAFAICSAFVFPRIRPQYPGRALPAFMVVAFLFFIGMLTAVEVFGAEPAEKKAGEKQTTQATTSSTSTTSTSAPTSATTTTSTTTTKAAAPSPAPKPKPKPQTVAVTEKEFKIELSPAALHSGPVTFQIKNAGAIPHDLAIVGGPKSKLISGGGSATLTATLKAGPIELYCSVDSHKKLGMDLKLTVG